MLKEIRAEASYDAVAELYDRHWGLEFSTLAEAAFGAYLLPLLSPGAAVLDLCCGTGLMLAHLDRLGFQTYGVDESAKMLVIARRNAPLSQLQPADMAAFRWEMRFDAAVSFYNSLNHARSYEHLRATVAHVARHLTIGGWLLFDYVLPEAFETAWEWSEQAGPNTIQYRYDQSSGQAICLINRRERIRQTSFQPGQIRDALQHAGLEVVDEMPMAGSRPHNGRRLVLARKQ